MKHQSLLSCLIIVSLFGMASLSYAAKAALTLSHLRCEYKVNPLGIDIAKPRLSWEIEATERNVMQSAYQIRVAMSLANLQQNKNLVWDSGKISSDASIHVVYEGPALASRTRYYWQVRIWDAKGKATAWSQAAYWEMGLLNPSDWQASWIQPTLPEEEDKTNPSPLLRKEFTVDGKVASARAYITCLGLYEMELNGQRVGKEVFTPGWTAYDKRLQYQTYDITPLLKAGKNAIGVTLADGWYRGFLTWSGKKNFYGDKLALLVQVQITYENGREQIVGSDETWKCSTGPILASDIYHGETYDARLIKKGWSSPGYDDTGWAKVLKMAAPQKKLVAPAGPPVEKIEEIKAAKVIKTPKGETVVDLGQNMVGWVRLKVKGPAGTKVTLKHAEVLDKDGNFYIENLRGAKQTDEFILQGSGEEVFEPHFTFHGFRFVKVEGYPGELTSEAITGIVVHSAYAPTSNFECSNPMINQLQHNILWGQKGNFVDVPTDCPQRDERLGWMGDAQVFARTACFNGDVASFYTKWLKDVAIDQKPSGAVPHVIPNVLDREKPDANVASAGWADAAVVVPWIVYLSYGDKRVLEEQYPSMKAWVDYVANKAGDTYFWNMDFTFGDWLAYATTHSDYPGATTDKDFVCQAHFAHSTDLLQRTAEILGKKEDAAKYAELLQKIKKVFVDEFVTANGRISPNTQTAYSLALCFDLLPENMRQQAAKRLADDVNKFKHITTGFLGASLVCHALTDYGYYDEAFMLLNRQKYPSWLYPITRGATTIWERWDGIKANGTFQDAGMNSFNHYAYGAIGEWLYRVVAGIEIDPQQPGYKHILFQPHSGGGLTFVRAAVHSMYGPVACNWEIKDKRMQVTLEVPANTTATATLPTAKLADITESGKPIAKTLGTGKAVQKGNDVVVSLGSGRYVFEYPHE